MNNKSHLNSSSLQLFITLFIFVEETVAEVRFSGSEVTHNFLLSEIEPARYGKNSAYSNGGSYDPTSSYDSSRRVTVEATSDDEDGYFLADDDNYYDG